MASPLICYFSATGNSLAVARDLADDLDGRLVSISSTLGQNSVANDADTAGFVFPIYDFKPPSAVSDLVGRIDQIGSKYVFAICTYGIAPYRSLFHFRDALEAQGGRLAGGFAVAMPHNGIGSSAVSLAEREELLKRWEDRRGTISQYVATKAGKTSGATLEAGGLVGAVLKPSILRMMPWLFRFIGHIVVHGVDSLDFTAGEACDGCGICERVCPVDNIRLTSGTPVWLEHCAGCFACFHCCPRDAISTGGVDIGIAPYRHPGVRLGDIIR